MVRATWSEPVLRRGPTLPRRATGVPPGGSDPAWRSRAPIRTRCGHRAASRPEPRRRMRRSHPAEPSHVAGSRAAARLVRRSPTQRAIPVRPLGLRRLPGPFARAFVKPVGAAHMPVVKAGPNQFLLVGRKGRLENRGSAVHAILRPGTIYVLVPEPSRRPPSSSRRRPGTASRCGSRGSSSTGSRNPWPPLACSTSAAAPG